ncbi:MAG TPA: hypothetical protein VFB72_06035 [Verrucomicrobiae bacterium]|nr:hypothetical protein [Verrucomicrobiae bacterium]
MIAYIFVRSGIDWFEPSYTDKKEPSALLGDFKSYESISNVQAQLKEIGLTGRITWPTNGPPEDGKARLLVKSFKVCEKSGDLSLFFLNDRLEETIFFPESTEPFLSTFKKQYSLSFDVTNAVHVSPHTIAELNFRTTKQDKKSKPVISFFDERLKREDNAWEMHRIAGKQ